MHLPFIPDDLALAIAAFGEAAVGARLLQIRQGPSGSAAAPADPSACVSAEPRREPEEQTSATPLRDALAAQLEQMRAAIKANRQTALSTPRAPWLDGEAEAEQA
ncbi:MAG: hypothetical protein NW206_02910 [Hyphomonadaceae bacterium]|nr:hypothetical protein [Hyphomonadaceae bacterium]